MCVACNAFDADPDEASPGVSGGGYLETDRSFRSVGNRKIRMVQTIQH
jgi:hypothetical protein